MDYFVLACEVLFIIFTVYYTVEEAIEVSVSLDRDRDGSSRLDHPFQIPLLQSDLECLGCGHHRHLVRVHCFQCLPTDQSGTNPRRTAEECRQFR